VFARDPVSRLLRLDDFRKRLAEMHARVGLVFFMPETRDRFRRRLYRKWQKVGEERAMLLGTILASLELKAELNRRLRESQYATKPAPKHREVDRQR
jgi:hypothetical protein